MDLASALPRIPVVVSVCQSPAAVQLCDKDQLLHRRSPGPQELFAHMLRERLPALLGPGLG